jgi:radical SAM/Cys-rich protein
VLQLNLGKLCNMRCSHCHVDAGPHQGHTQMADAVVEQCIAAMERLQPTVVDLTGGAPELHPRFRDLVLAARRQGCHVIDRCNLTVLLLPALHDLAAFLAREQVEIVASLPQPDEQSTDAQRGDGTWKASIQALQRLNALGYGQDGSGLELDLVYNPAGASLPPPQAALEADYRRRLMNDFGIRFNRLFTLANMPIKRFAHTLAREGRHAQYMQLLIEHFNPQAAERVMCRSLVSVGWDGTLYDCDFNQMLALPAGGRRRTLWDIDRLDSIDQEAIVFRDHCYGCTAGAGSSCGGALA